MIEPLLDAMTLDGNPPGLERFDWGRPAAEIVAESMDADGAHDAGHLGRVLRNARRIVRKESHRTGEIDWEVLLAAVLFHDVVNLPKDDDHRVEASTLSAERAVEFFEGRSGFGEPRLNLLYECIRRHSFSLSAEPESLEAAIVRDADRLEAIGAVGIARTFYVSATMDGAISHPSDPFADERERDDTQFAVDHFFEKLLQLRGDFLTDAGREMAQRRHDVLVAFLDQFADEVGAELDL